MSALLEIEALNVDFVREGRVVSRALRGVDLDLEAGSAVGVVGGTGCGKTMTGLSVVRMLPAGARVSGRIAFQGRDLLALPEREVRSSPSCSRVPRASRTVVILPQCVKTSRLLDHRFRPSRCIHDRSSTANQHLARTQQHSNRADSPLIHLPRRLELTRSGS